VEILTEYSDTTYHPLMNYHEVLLSEAGEHLMSVFRALWGLPKFRKLVDQNFIIKQYYDSSNGRILRVEIKDKDDKQDVFSEYSEFH